MRLKQPALKGAMRKPVLLTLGIIFLAGVGTFTYRWATLPRYGGQDIHYWWGQCIKPDRVTWIGWQDPISVDATLHAFKGMGEKGATFVVKRYAQSFEEPIYERFHQWLQSRARNKTNDTLVKRVLLKTGSSLPAPRVRYLDRAVADRLLMGTNYPTELAEKEVSRLLQKRNHEVNHELLRYVQKICQTRTNILPSVEVAIIKGNLTPSRAIPILLHYGFPAKGCIPALGEELCDQKIRSYAALALFDREEIGKTNILPYIGKALYNDDPRFTAVLIRKIGACGPTAKASVPDLIKKLGDEWYFVRAEAARALAAIGRDALPAIPKLNVMKSDAHEEVVFEAARAKLRLESLKAEKLTLP